MKHLKRFNENTELKVEDKPIEKKSYSLDSFISDNFDVYNDQFGHEKRWKGTARESTVPHLVKSRAWVGLLLLTQATKKEQGLTDTIVKIAETLEPIMRDLGPYNTEKYHTLLDSRSWVHNRDYNEKEYINRVVAVCAPLDFILTCYFESEKEAPFDLNEYASLYHKIKREAEKVFTKSIWCKK